MIYFHTALRAEAKEIIAHYNMKALDCIGGFSVFSDGSSAVLAISGTGEFRATSCVSALCGAFPPKNSDIFVNFGICGGVNREFSLYDNILLCKTAFGSEQNTGDNREIFCDLSFLSADNFKQLTDKYNIKVASAPTEVVDMESYGALFAAQCFFDPSRTFSFKTISDFAEETAKNNGILDKNVLKNAIENSKEAFFEFTKFAENFARENNATAFDFAPEELEKIDRAREFLHLSFMDTEILKAYLWKEKLLTGKFMLPEEIFSMEIKDKNQGEKLLKEIVGGKFWKKVVKIKKRT